MRLDKCIADHSAYSRKEVKELLRRGSVRVNGAPEQDPGRQVDPEGDEIMLAGVILPTALHRTYMLNKPKGCISSTRTGKTKTVVEFLPPELRKGIFPDGGPINRLVPGGISQSIILCSLPSRLLKKLLKLLKTGWCWRMVPGACRQGWRHCRAWKIRRWWSYMKGNFTR